jgi:hypothetical protein
MSFPPKEHADAAIESGDYWFSKTGVYSFPSFRLAQTGIESANGTAVSGVNNYWGVKANKAQIAAGKFKVCLTHEVIHGKTVAIYDKFASYDSLRDGYIEQAKLLVTSPYYEKSRHDDNPEQYAIDVAVHYATAPNYPQVIIAYMRSHDLARYDRVTAVSKAIPTKLKPPIHEEKKAQSATTAGAVVAGAATVALASGHVPTVWILCTIGVGLGLAVAGFAKFRSNQALLKQILSPLPADHPVTPLLGPH